MKKKTNKRQMYVQITKINGEYRFSPVGFSSSFTAKQDGTSGNYRVFDGAKFPISTVGVPCTNISHVKRIITNYLKLKGLGNNQTVTVTYSAITYY